MQQPLQLFIPLDHHSGNAARKLGILPRKQDDWKAVEELTGVLRNFDPDNPVKYDFPPFGPGAIESFNADSYYIFLTVINLKDKRKLLQEILVEEFLEPVLVPVSYRDKFLSENYPATINRLNLFEIYDKGAMNSHEFAVRQLFFHHFK